MERPTEQQLRDPAWWDENIPFGATHFISGKSVFSDVFWRVVDGVGVEAWAVGVDSLVHYRDPSWAYHKLPGDAIPRPTKSGPEAWVKDLPERAPAGWQDWKIAPGSWPYWMLQRMTAETGRMSYDNPVKCMIRDLWSQVDRPEKQKQQDEIQREHYAKEQRERAETIEAAVNACPYPGSNSTRIDVEALYDAGLLRKGAE